MPRSSVVLGLLPALPYPTTSSCGVTNLAGNPLAENHAYSGASLGYQLISIFGGAVAPLISVALLAGYGSTVPVSLYLLAMAVITLVAVTLATESARKVWRIDDRREEATYSSGKGV
jgi:hypothetical protein